MARGACETANVTERQCTNSYMKMSRVATGFLSCTGQHRTTNLLQLLWLVEVISDRHPEQRHIQKMLQVETLQPNIK